MLFLDCEMGWPMRMQMQALLLFTVIAISGCAVSQGPGPSSLAFENEEAEERHRPTAYRRSRMGIPYYAGISGLGSLGIGGVGLGGICP